MSNVKHGASTKNDDYMSMDRNQGQSAKNQGQRAKKEQDQE